MLSEGLIRSLRSSQAVISRDLLMETVGMEPMV
jgi:hypothetical protein